MREQAQRLIAHLQRLEADAPAEERKRALASLMALDLREEDARQVRDACAHAHEGLLSAQAFQAEARAEIAKLKRGASPEAAPERNEVASSAAASLALSRSESTLAAAKPALARCRDLSAAFVLQHR